MKKIKAFSLIEVVFALLVLSLMVLFFMPALGTVDLTKKTLNKEEATYLQAKNAMEMAMGHKLSEDFPLVEVKIEYYSESLEKVEVLDAESKEILLYALRKK